MRIQWSSRSVEQALGRLRGVREGLEACNVRVHSVRRRFADADPDGQNRAMRVASARFEECCIQLRHLTECVEYFESALRRAEARFEDAEAQAIRCAESIDAAERTKWTPVRRVDGIRWQPTAVVYMPQARDSAPPLPDWLEDLLS